MVPERSTEKTVDNRQSSSGSSTLVNALIGAVAGIVLSFIPFSTILGGAISGYLEDGTNEDGLKVGAIAGFIMFVPFLLFAYFLGAVMMFGAAPGMFGGILVFVLFFAAVYTIGAAMLGGFLGIYLRRELGKDRRQPDRW